VQQHAKALRFVSVSGILGAGAAALIAFATAHFVTSSAEATPALGQGKPCTACHTSSSPTKNDLKK
jgi:hypothetical protein